MHASAHATHRGLLASLAAAILVSAPALSASAVGPAPQPHKADEPLTGPECLIGTWAVDPAADGARITEALNAVATDITVTSEGDATMTFTEDTKTVTYDNEQTTVEFTMDGHRYLESWLLNGSRSMAYEAGDFVIETPATDLSDDVIALNTRTEDEWGIQTLPPSVPSLRAGLTDFSGAWAYECSGDELTFYELEGAPRLVEVEQVRALPVEQVLARRSAAPSPAEPASAKPRPAQPRPAQPRPGHGTAPRAAAATPALGAPAFTG